MTGQQQRAIETDEREVLVVAGAGSGKTRVLTLRIHHLLTQRGASPGEFLILTFTRKAAGEMIARLVKVLGDDVVRRLTIGTFHSVALSILRVDGDSIGYIPETLTIVDPRDADTLLRRTCVDLGYARSKRWRDQATGEHCESLTWKPDPLNITAVGWIRRVSVPLPPHLQSFRGSSVIRCSASKTLSHFLHS